MIEIIRAIIAAIFLKVSDCWCFIEQSGQGRTRIRLIPALRDSPNRLPGSKKITKIGIGLLERRIRPIFLARRAMTDVKGSTHITTPNWRETALAHSLPRDRPWLIAQVSLALPAH